MLLNRIVENISINDDYQRDLQSLPISFAFGIHIRNGESLLWR
jgi:hypothetical protein